MFFVFFSFLTLEASLLTPSCIFEWYYVSEQEDGNSIKNEYEISKSCKVDRDWFTAYNFETFFFKKNNSGSLIFSGRMCGVVPTDDEIVFNSIYYDKRENKRVSFISNEELEVKQDEYFITLSLNNTMRVGKTLKLFAGKVFENNENPSFYKADVLLEANSKHQLSLNVPIENNLRLKVDCKHN